MRLITRLFFYFAWGYVAFLTLFKCRNECTHSNIAIQAYCGQVNHVVYPVWDLVIHPRLAAIDSQYGISRAVEPYVESATLFWLKFDEQYRLSYKVDNLWTRANLWLATAGADGYAEIKLHTNYWIARGLLLYEGKRPLIAFYVESYRGTLSRAAGKAIVHVRTNSSLFIRSSAKHIQRSYEIYVAPTANTTFKKIHAHEYTQYVLSLPLVQWLLTKAQALAWAVKSAQLPTAVQQKTDFLRDEFFSLINSDRFKNSGERAGDILSKEEIVELADSDYSDSDDEVYTITSTLTKTILQGETADASEIKTDAPLAKQIAVPIAPEDEEVAKYGMDSSKLQIEHEIEYWRSKVQKMLDMSYASLETDLGPFLQATIEDLKERISANFSTVQQENYARYKVMAEMIKSIDKDSEVLRTTGEIVETPEIDRQLMRDKIKEAHEAVESAMKDVETVLNLAHGPVLEQYFDVAQNTIDVLESFAETTILEFSTRLSGLLSILEENADYNDELGWKAWKEFHKIKEQVFTIRDKILDEAHLYKDLPSVANKPHGLQDWADYLNNVKFHIRFLLGDNDDYLKLVRAKANVAYQLREGLTRQIETKKAEEKEAAKREVERKEAEKRDAERREIEAQEAQTREAELKETEAKLQESANITEEIEAKSGVSSVKQSEIPEATSLRLGGEGDLSEEQAVVEVVADGFLEEVAKISEAPDPIEAEEGIEADEKIEAGEKDEAQEEAPESILEVL